MAFETTLNVTNDIATIFLSGDLDASTATIFQDKVKEAVDHQPKPKKLVLHMEKLDYMASAGLRILIFSKQQMGGNVVIYIVKPNDEVRDTLEKTGFHHSVVFLDSYDLTHIASL